jgi:hypothetical protein
VPRSGAPQPDADAVFLSEDLRRMSLAVGKMPTGHPDVPPSDTAPPPPESGSVPRAMGTMPPWAFRHGLNAVAQGYASSISTSMGVYEELPGHHLCSTLDLMASTPASECLDSTETSDTKPRVVASHHNDLMDQQSYMHLSYYYFGAPDSGSADDCYDLTRECFHIDGAIASDSEAEAAAGRGNATSLHAAPPGARDGARLYEAGQGAQLEQILEL